MNSENSGLALVKLMELFNHSSVAITQRYLGLRQDDFINFRIELLFSNTFLLFLPQFLASNGKEGHFDKKVLLKLSSFVKFSQNFKVAKITDNGTTLLVCAAVVAFCISFGVGCCLYQRLRQCEKPHGCGKGNKFPHLLFYPLLSGNWLACNNYRE